MNWGDTRLWKTISARTNDVVRRTLENCLPSIEEVLRSGGTSPLDFTLHDNQHSFRVAERIFEIAERQIPQFSDHELGLLLLSAYLHDIGMSPSRKVVNPTTSMLTPSGIQTRASAFEKMRLVLPDGTHIVISDEEDVLQTFEEAQSH